MAVLVAEKELMPGLRAFWRLPLSRKHQAVASRLARLKTHLFYRWRLRGCGVNSTVMKPLFWTPEFISLGNDVLIWPGCRIEAAHDGARDAHIVIGDGVTFQQNCHVTAGGILRIEAGTTVLCDVVITDMDHGYEEIGVSAYHQRVEVRETRVGRNCFIGAGARLLAGTMLGEQCIVAANAVVRGTFPAFTVLAGSPARVVKRFDSHSGAWTSAGIS